VFFVFLVFKAISACGVTAAVGDYAQLAPRQFRPHPFLEAHDMQSMAVPTTEPLEGELMRQLTTGIIP
jgi:hypothetical protein